jgi:YggT family protein
MSVEEPPPPQRGTTAAERGPDVSAQEKKLDESRTWTQFLVAALNPKLVLQQADGYPVGVKQFLQFCLIIVYPAWLALVLFAWVLWPFFKLLEGLLWLAFWPVRAIHKKNNPEESAAHQAEQRAKKEAAEAARKQG